VVEQLTRNEQVVGSTPMGGSGRFGSGHGAGGMEHGASGLAVGHKVL